MESLGTGARGGYGLAAGWRGEWRAWRLKQLICFAYHLMLVNQLLAGWRL